MYFEIHIPHVLSILVTGKYANEPTIHKTAHNSDFDARPQTPAIIYLVYSMNIPQVTWGVESVIIYEDGRVHSPSSGVVPHSLSITLY